MKIQLNVAFQRYNKIIFKDNIEVEEFYTYCNLTNVKSPKLNVWKPGILRNNYCFMYADEDDGRTAILKAAIEFQKIFNEE